MYWNFQRYRKASQMANGSTDKWELPDCGKLTGIKLDFRMTNAAAIHGTNKARIVDHLTAIRISDGGKRTLFEMTGQELRALNFYQQATVMPETATLYGAKSQLTTLFIPFGRYQGDRDFMLDLDKYCTLWLEITNDLSATQCATGNCNVDIQLVEAIGLTRVPANYIRHQEWRAEKPRANGQVVYQKLPSGEPIQKIMVQLDPDLEDVGKAVSDPITDSNSIKLHLDQGKAIIIEGRPKDIMRLNAKDYGIVMTGGRYLPSETQYWDTAVAYVQSFAAAGIGTQSGIVAEFEDANDRFQVTGAAPHGSELMISLHAIGVGYYHTMVLYDALTPSGSDLLLVGCGSVGCKEGEIEWTSNTDDHYLRTVVSSIVEQGKM